MIDRARTSAAGVRARLTTVPPLLSAWLVHRWRRVVSGLQSNWLPLLTLGFVALTLVASASVWLVASNGRYQRLVRHTHEVETESYRLLALVQGIVAGKRGYVITGDESLLGPYDEGINQARDVLLGIKTLTADNPVQQQEIYVLLPVLETKLADAREVVETRRRGDTAAAFALVRTGRGNELLESVRDGIDRLLSEEERLMTERTAAAAASGRWLLVVTLGGTLLVILLAAGVLAAIRRREIALMAAEASLRSVNEDLEQTVAARTTALREANAEIQRFAYVVSHDLRAPLVNIMGFTSELATLRPELVRRLMAAVPAGGTPDDHAASAEDLDAEFGEALGFIQASAARMDRLIGAILQLSRVGHRIVVPEQIDMRALVTQIADSLQAQCQARGAQIEVSPSLPALHADPLAVEQIFTNLIENAVKYLEDGRPGRIEVTGEAAPDRRGMAVFEVRDNGRGIAPEDQERIFDLFRRAGRQDRPGEGIGLAHVRTLVRAMQGSISCTSTLGQGTTVRVRLPRHAIARRD